MRFADFTTVTRDLTLPEAVADAPDGWFRDDDGDGIPNYLDPTKDAPKVDAGPLMHLFMHHGHGGHAGHHATERYGVQALGEWLAQGFGLEHRFVDCDNPV